MRFDIVVRRTDGSLVAIVELRMGSEPWSATRAAEYRRNLILSGIIKSAPPYFLFLTPDTSFLWIGASSPTPEYLPQHTFSMSPVVERYSAADRPLSGREFESLVLRWFNELTAIDQHSIVDELHEPDRLLAESGFLQDIRGAMVLYEEAVA